MTHRDRIDRYPGTIAELAQDLGDLRYDALAEFLRHLSLKLSADGKADDQRGRPRLSAALQGAAANLGAAAENIEQAWAISAPHM